MHPLLPVRPAPLKTPMNQAEDICQCYLIVPPDTPADAVTALASEGGLADAACLLLRADENGQIDSAKARALLQLAHGADIPLLLERDWTAAKEIGADGVHIPGDEESYAQARELLGDDAIIGAGCGMSRHAAMTLGELGADYVAFWDADSEALKEIVEWWAEVTVVPCVAWDLADLETARDMAQAGADFVALGKPVWSHPQGAAAAMRDLAGIFEKGEAIV